MLVQTFVVEPLLSLMTISTLRSLQGDFSAASRDHDLNTTLRYSEKIKHPNLLELGAKKRQSTNCNLDKDFKQTLSSLARWIHQQYH